MTGLADAGEAMIASDVTAIMTDLGCRPEGKCDVSGFLGFRDAYGVIVTVTRKEGNLLRISRWSRPHETILTDERDFRKAAEAVLRQCATTDSTTWKGGCGDD